MHPVDFGSGIDRPMIMLILKIVLYMMYVLNYGTVLADQRSQQLKRTETTEESSEKEGYSCDLDDWRIYEVSCAGKDGGMHGIRY